MLINTAARLRQAGYRYVATFNQKERAEARTALHRKQGLDAQVCEVVNSKGVKTFSVYLKEV